MIDVFKFLEITIEKKVFDIFYVFFFFISSHPLCIKLVPVTKVNLILITAFSMLVQLCQTKLILLNKYMYLCQDVMYLSIHVFMSRCEFINSFICVEM